MRLLATMKAWVALMLMTSTLAFLPAADAHACNGGISTCGDCVKGENHQHNDVSGQCASGPGYYSENGWKGQRAEVPAAGFLLVLAGVALAVALARRG